jgi:hypothetical protein
MIRRRRAPRDIPFSFDSFLDLVTNVVGIILRLILVAWVGARTYKGPPPPPPPAPPALEEAALPPEPPDPLAPEVERRQRELAGAEADLLEQVRRWEAARQRHQAAAGELDALAARRQGLEAEGRSAAGAQAGAPAAALSLAQIAERSKRLTTEIEALRRAPSEKQALRYRTPVSRPLQSEELMFECRRGRVAFIDVGTMVEEIRQGLREKGELLRSQWEVREATVPVGAFRLRYVVERERGPLLGSGPAGAPDDRGGFRYSLTGWEVEPVDPDRGETAEAALKPGSAFRKVAERIDSQMTAVTFWVYPDSFPAYRRLRDYLYDRDVVVAGRPLPDGTPIASRREGTASRGQ